MGELNAAQRQALLAITDLERLERLFLKVLDAPSWNDLRQTP